MKMLKKDMIQLMIILNNYISIYYMCELLIIGIILIFILSQNNIEGFIGLIEGFIGHINQEDLIFNTVSDKKTKSLLLKKLLA